jgi:rod shape-determining protein MreC
MAIDMGSKGSFGRSGKGSPNRALVVLCALSLVLFTVSAREGETGPVHTARGVVQTIVSPIRFVGSAISAPFSALGNVFSNLTADSETLSELKTENEQLQASNAELAEAEQTATRLEGLLQLKSTYNLQSTAARVISGSTDSWTSTVTIDKGSTSGIAVGMPVTDSYGAIGQVSECGPTTSVVRLTSDENSGVSAMVQSSRAQGQLVGSADGTLKLTLIKTDQTIAVGDLVVTSGLGGVYPKGLPLGKVTNIEKTTGALYYDVTVAPLATSQSYEEVLVITSLSEDQVASDEDVASADDQETGASTAAATQATTTDTTGE